jgi:hypothetical protein
MGSDDHMYGHPCGFAGMGFAGTGVVMNSQHVYGLETVFSNWYTPNAPRYYICDSAIVLSDQLLADTTAFWILQPFPSGTLSYYSPEPLCNRSDH